MERTQIQVTKETRKKLQKIKITNRESYDEIINRLMEKNVSNKI